MELTGISHFLKSKSLRVQYLSKEICTAETNPIYSGSHALLNSTHMIIFATYYDTLPPTVQNLWISGYKYALTLDLGNTSKNS
jgi:hypothetical protein